MTKVPPHLQQSNDQRHAEYLTWTEEKRHAHSIHCSSTCESCEPKFWENSGAWMVSMHTDPEADQ